MHPLPLLILFKCVCMLTVMPLWLQYNEQFKVYEPLEYSYDICDTILLWEQVNVQSFSLLYLPTEESFVMIMSLSMQYRNMTTVLTREYLDVRPDGWLDYAAKRIAQLYDFLDTLYGLSFPILRFGFTQIWCTKCFS